MTAKRNTIFLLCLVVAVLLIAIGACFSYIIRAYMKKQVTKVYHFYIAMMMIDTSTSSVLLVVQRHLVGS